MDLAKIRKKSLQAIRETGEEALSALSSLLPQSAQDKPPVVAVAPADTEVDFFKVDLHSQPTNSTVSSPLPDFTVPRCTPLEAILAGRTAAGCDDELIPTEDTVGEVVTESYLEFLCFRVSDEIYGIDIMDIKEIFKLREVTEVPRAPAFVLGILSLRGVIIPINDMCIRLGLARNGHRGKERVVVVKSKNRLSGLLVDEVFQVVGVKTGAFEEAPAVMDGINRDFISGIGRSEERLIIIINVENCADIDLI
jgi:purine-binding chemotaxis protein CheW